MARMHGNMDGFFGARLPRVFLHGTARLDDVAALPAVPAGEPKALARLVLLPVTLYGSGLISLDALAFAEVLNGPLAPGGIVDDDATASRRRTLHEFLHGSAGVAGNGAVGYQPRLLLIHPVAGTGRRILLPSFWNSFATGSYPLIYV